MNVSTSDIEEDINKLVSRRIRFTASLVSYDRIAGTAIVSSVIGAPESQQSAPIPVSKALQLMDSALQPGTVVILEKVTGRTTVIVDVVDRPINTGITPVQADRVNVGAALTTSVVFRNNDPQQGAIAWSYGTVTYQGTSFAISSGAAVSGRFVYWPTNATAFSASDIPPQSSGNVERLLIAINRDGYANTVLNGVDGYGLVSGSVTGVALASGAVHAGAYGDGSISEPKFGDEVVPTRAIISGAVTLAKMAVNSVSSGQVIDENITEPKLALNAVSSGKILAGAVVSGKIAPLAVVSGNIAPLAVVSGNVAPDAIMTLNIQNGNITLAKMATDSVDAPQVVARAILSGKVGVGEVHDDHLAPNMRLNVAKISGSPTYKNGTFLTDLSGTTQTITYLGTL